MQADKLHPDEPDISTELVRRLLGSQLPTLADLPLTEVKSTGTVNVIYRLGDDLCVRLPRGEQRSRCLDTELEWLPTLAPHLPVTIPQPRERGEPASGFPYTWAVYDWIDGDPLVRDQLVDETGTATELARFVAALRQVDPLDGPRSGRRPLRQLDEMTRTAILAVKDFDRDTLTSAWEQSLGAPEWDGQPVWRHCDLLPPNLLVREGRLHAVIDFGGVGVGDPALDVIPAWSVFGRRGRVVYRDALAVDDGTWARARGFALHEALMIIPYYERTNPGFVQMAKDTVHAVLEDLR